MGPNQLKQAADAKRDTLRFPGRFDGHLQDLQTFAEAHPTFDLDVATEVNPALWDGTRPEGVAALDFWADLYEALAKSPRYTVLYRYQYPDRHSKGAFGEIDYGAPRAWLRLFEGLKPEDIVFEKVDGVSMALINKPSILFTSSNVVTKTNEPTTLFDDKPLDLNLYLLRNVNGVQEDQALGVEFVHGEDLDDLVPNTSQINLEIQSSFLRFKLDMLEL